MHAKQCTRCGAQMTPEGYNRFGEPRWWRCRCEENGRMTIFDEIRIDELEAALANERAINALLETYNAALEAELARLREWVGFVPDGDVSDPAPSPATGRR